MKKQRNPRFGGEFGPCGSVAFAWLLALFALTWGAHAFGQGAPTAPSRLGAPTNPTAVPPAPNKVTVSWNTATDSVDVMGYKVERCQGSGCSNFTLIATTKAASFTDSGLLSSTTYTYRIRAMDAAGHVGAYSNVASTTTIAAIPASVSYSYDDATRLVGATYSDSHQTLYALDAAGNRTGVVLGTVGIAQFDQSSYTPNINTTLTINVTRSDGSAHATVDYHTTDGSASSSGNKDYTTTSGTLSWNSGDTSAKPITIAISNQSSYGANKSFTVTLTNPLGIAVPNPSATVTINNTNPKKGPNPPGNLTLGVVTPVSVTFTWTAPDDPGGPGVGSYQVYREGRPVGAPTTALTFTDTSAQPGMSYHYTVVAIDTLNTPSAPSAALIANTPATYQITDSSGNVLPAAAALYTSQSQCTQLLQTCLYTLSTAYGTPTVVFSIRNPIGTLPCPAGGSQQSGGAVGYSRPSNTSCVIVATPGAYGQPPQSPPPGTIALAQATYSLPQSATTVNVTVVRSGDSGTTASVSYTVGSTNGTAIAGTDYTATASGTLSWGVNDTSSRTIPVTIFANGNGAATKTINITLSSPAAPFGSVVLGAPASGTIVLANTIAGALQLDQSSYSTNELAGSVTLKVSRVNGSFGAASLQYATADGTATAGHDYTATQGTLNWAAGDTSIKSITVSIANLGVDGPSKTFSVILSNPVGAILPGGVSSQSAPITIIDASTYQITDDAGNVISAAAGLYSSSWNCTQPLNTCLWTLTTTYGTPTTVWTIRSGLPTLPCPSGQAQSFGAFGYSRPSNSSCRINATPAAYGQPPLQPAPGTISLSPTTYSVLETNTSVTVTATRTGGSTGAVSVSYGTGGGTAVAGTQYTATSGTLSWADGDSATKSFSVPIIYTGIWNAAGSETIGLTLSSPSGSPAPTLGTATGTITITDSEPGSLQFAQSSYTVNQNVGSATIVVTRANGGYGAISVNYSTANGTAIAGTDYTAASGTLSWGNGDTTSKSISVPIFNSNVFGPNKAFTIALSGAAGGATISGATATVNINNTNAVVPPSVPTGLTASNVTPSQATVSWSASTDSGGPGLGGYRIFRNGTQVTTTTATSYTDTNVTAGVSYSYTVSAYDTVGTESAQSSPLSVSIPPDWQITDSAGNVIPAAASLYSSTIVCTQLLQICQLRVFQSYGAGTEVFAITSNTSARQPCPSGTTQLAVTGYTRPSTSSCQIQASPATYGH